MFMLYGLFLLMAQRCETWVNLALAIMEEKLPQPHLVDIS
jgi:hypothetical protein